MSTKMKGLLKGLRYISQIFDEEKEQEMQIGLPTDVKHVAHIGWDGPTSVDSPSWMKEFDSTQATGFSAPLAVPGDPKDNPDIKWVSEDSKRGQRTKSSQGKDLPELPKSSRRQSLPENSSNDHSPRKKDPSAKSRQSRRKEAKDYSSDGSISSDQQPQEPGCPAPDIPRKARRKKSKELVSEGGSRRARNRASSSNGGDTSADPGLDPGPGLQKPSSLPSLDGEEIESRVTFEE